MSSPECSVGHVTKQYLVICVAKLPNEEQTGTGGAECHVDVQKRLCSEPDGAARAI
jgi:hypothetical protein